MTHGWSTYSESTIARLKAEGHGLGVGRAYKPWLTVRDVSSLGQSTRCPGWKTGRKQDVLSKLELHSLYCFDWSESITDIREQYPLPREETLHIAQQLGIRHPQVYDHNRQTHTPVVMTTDFLITRTWPDRTREEALAVKPSTELGSRRVLEKLEIERVYWAKQGVDWGIVTELDIDHTLALNVKLIHDRYRYASDTPLTLEELSEVAEVLTRETQNSTEPLRRITSYCDRTLGLGAGTSLAVVYYLIATRQWLIDMSAPIDPTQRLSLRKVNLKA